MFGRDKKGMLPRKPRPKNLIIYAVTVAILMGVALFSAQLSKGLQSFELVKAPRLPFAVEVFDVGQGDAIFIRVDDGGDSAHTMLIDAGDVSGGAKVAAMLDIHNVHSLDYVVVSHLHNDHIGGIPNAIEGRTVGKIIEPPCPADLIPTGSTYEHYLDAVEASGAEYATVGAGDSFDLGAAHVEVLAPGDMAVNDLNNASLVLRVTYEDCTCLFTGDMEAEEEKWLLSQGVDISADFLKVAHHGSNTSSTEEFLAAVKPKFAAISCSKDNEYGHPAPSTLQHLQESPNAPEIHITAEEGEIEFTYTHSPVPMQITTHVFVPTQTDVQHMKEETP